MSEQLEIARTRLKSMNFRAGHFFTDVGVLMANSYGFFWALATTTVRKLAQRKPKDPKIDIRS